MAKRNVGVSDLDLLQSVVLGGKEAEILFKYAKAGLRPARPRLDRQARIQFWGVLNVSLRAFGA